MSLALQAVVPVELARAAGIDIADARRIVSLVHREGALPSRAPATIRRAALDRARGIGHIPRVRIADRLASHDDPFVKYVIDLEDGAAIETVRIPLEKAGRYSVCVSSQVGCALGCAFCRTGRMGLVRNLETWEIVEQVRIVRGELPPEGRVHGVVFQGMGEPLANVDRVILAIRVLTDPSALAIDQRNITVTTAGLPAGIRRLTSELPHVRLGVSLGDVRRDRRRSLMPIDARHPLDEVLEAAGAHAETSGYAPMFAYTLLAGDNDGPDAAEALAEVIRSFAARYGKRPRLSLIPFNPIDTPSAGLAHERCGEPRRFERQSQTALDSFRDDLRARGVASVLRYSGGADVGAACGQLATNRFPRPRAGSEPL
jgi:23S rRNA (adenine2503-C2)-methyltransferase